MYGQLPPDSAVWHFPVRLDRVVDGDTIDVRCDLGFNCFRDVRLRLYGIDTGEIFGSKRGSEEYERGKAHQAFVRDWFESRDTDGDAWPYRAYTLKEPGKYGRWLADVVDQEGDSLVAALLTEFGEEIQR